MVIKKVVIGSKVKYIELFNPSFFMFFVENEEIIDNKRKYKNFDANASSAKTIKSFSK